MRTAFFCLSLFLSFLTASAQDQPDYASIRLDVKEDYTEAVNQTALKAASYLLSTPLNKKSLPRLQASQFLLRWMSGTPQFSFELGEQAVKLAKGNDDLLIVYMAAMAKYCLENPASKEETRKIKVGAVKQVLSYCELNGISMNKELKKLQKANEAGALEEHVK